MVLIILFLYGVGEEIMKHDKSAGVAIATYLQKHRDTMKRPKLSSATKRTPPRGR